MTTTPHSLDIPAAHRRLIRKISNVTQAEAADARPTALDLTSSVPAGAYDALRAIARAQGYTVAPIGKGTMLMPESDGETNHFTSTLILSGRLIGSPASAVDVLAHELAHVIQFRSGFWEFIFRNEKYEESRRMLLEGTAEAVADGVTSWLGIDHSAEHAQYIANWTQMAPPEQRRLLVTTGFTKQITRMVIDSLKEKGVNPR